METLAGKVSHYYGAISVASVELYDRIETGDMIHFKGHTTDFEQKVESMHIMHREVKKGVKGQIIGIKVSDFVRKNDLVYRIEN